MRMCRIFYGLREGPLLDGPAMASRILFFLLRLPVVNFVALLAIDRCLYGSVRVSETLLLSAVHVLSGVGPGGLPRHPI